MSDGGMELVMVKKDELLVFFITRYKFQVMSYEL